MKKNTTLATLFFALFFFTRFLLWGQISETKLTYGVRDSLYSQQLKEQRKINLYLPTGFSLDSAQNYPVIYLLDGSAEEDFLHVVGLTHFLSFTWLEMMPKCVVVGIENVDRKRDFTFHTNNEEYKKKYPTTGHSARFISFLEAELLPFIEKKYRLNTHKTLIGQSLGGLLASEILFKKPQLFDRYIVVSPSLWWDNESLLKKECELKNNHKAIDVFLAVGNEGKIMENEAKSLHKILKNIKSSHLNLHFSHMPDENHATILHQAVYKAFKIYYPSRLKE